MIRFFRFTFILFAALSGLRAAEPLRLDSVAAVRFERADDGKTWIKHGLLTSLGQFRTTESYVVLDSVSVPADALNKNLISYDAWLAYDRLGTEAVTNFISDVDATHYRIGERTYLDITAHPEARLSHGAIVNLSSRGWVAPGQPMVGGFVIDQLHRWVLLRAVGPTLGSLGVGTPLPDPFLTLYRRNTAIYFNDNWSERPDRDALRQTAEKVGAFPLPAGTKDSALLVELPPGIYTAHVESADQQTGEVLLEIYSVPE